MTVPDPFEASPAALYAASDQMVEALKPVLNVLGDIYRACQAAGLPHEASLHIVTRYIRFFAIAEPAP